MTPIATRALRPSSAAGPLPRLTEPRVRVMLIHQSSSVQNALPAHRRLLTLQRPQSEGQPKDIDRKLVSEWQHSALAQIRFRDPFTGIPTVDESPAWITRTGLSEPTRTARRFGPDVR